MTTLHQWQMPEDSAETARSSMKIGPAAEKHGSERRRFRRHDMEQQGVAVERCDAQKGTRQSFGRLVDISAGGVRIRANQQAVHADQQIRVPLELPDYAGICPFVDTTSGQPTPKREWVGWMTISRVAELSESDCEVAGELVDMEEMDRGMLGLYLSTQPLAA